MMMMILIMMMMLIMMMILIMMMMLMMLILIMMMVIMKMILNSGQHPEEPNGKILLMGGDTHTWISDTETGLTNDVEVYNPRPTASSSSLCPSSPPPNLPVPVFGHSCASSLCCGGAVDRDYTRTGQCHRLQNGTWRVAPSLPSGHYRGALVQLSGKMTWMGGLSGPWTKNTVYVLEEGGWTGARAMLARRWGHCAVVYHDNVAVVTGEEWKFCYLLF